MEFIVLIVGGFLVFAVTTHVSGLISDRHKPKTKRKNATTTLDIRQLADISLQAHNYDQARGYYNQLIADYEEKLVVNLAPHEGAELYVAYAQTYGLQNDLSTALRAFERVMALYPQYALTYVELGKIYTRLRDFEAAKDCLTEARRLLHEFPSVQSFGCRENLYLAYAWLLAWQSDYEGAHEFCRKSRTLHMSAIRGIVYFLQGLENQAIACFSVVLQANFAHNARYEQRVTLLALMGQAVTLHERGDTQLAIEVWQRVLELEKRCAELAYIEDEFYPPPRMVQEIEELMSSFRRRA
jgi:tetratricopeptide (TPR) repeat protein